MRDVALFFHLLGALLFVAGIVVAGVAFEAARRRDRPGEIALLLGLTRVGLRRTRRGARDPRAYGVPAVGRHRSGLPSSIQRWNTAIRSPGHAPSHGIDSFWRRSTIASACSLTSA
jgi:hypothetical protein